MKNSTVFGWMRSRAGRRSEDGVMVELGTYIAFALLLVAVVGTARAWDR